FSLGHREFVKWGPVAEADIRNAAAVTDICQAHGVVAAIHFAACAAVAESVADPAKYYDNNVAGTLSLLDGLRNAGVNVIVFSSSCAVYGTPETQPITEDTAANPINPYGASKLMVERILEDYGRAYGLRWSALRYFNASGADFESEIGEFRIQETHLIPRAMMWIQGHIEDFRVFGTDYPTPDGTAIRDFIHVSDLAEAHIMALRQLLAGDPGGRFNLGSGSGHSVQQVLSEIARATGARFRTVTGQRRPGDPAILVADPARSVAKLGFVAERSSLETIVRSAWAWHQKAHPRVRTSSAL